MTGKPVPVFKAFQICWNLYILFVNISRTTFLEFICLCNLSIFELSWLLDPCCTKVDGSVHVNHRTSCGLLVDVAALRKFGPQVTSSGDTWPGMARSRQIVVDVVSRCYSSRLLSRCWICRRSLHGDTPWQPGTSFLRRSSTDGFVHVDLDSNVTSVRSLDHVRGPESKIDPRVKSQQVSASLSKSQQVSASLSKSQQVTQTHMVSQATVPADHVHEQKMAHSKCNVGEIHQPETLHFLQLEDDPAAAGVVIEGAVALRQKMTQHLLLLNAWKRVAFLAQISAYSESNAEFVLFPVSCLCLILLWHSNESLGLH